MSLNPGPIRDAITSHAKALGVFRKVNGHEPKNAPGQGLHCSTWFDAIAALPAGSGLAATTALLTFRARVGTSMLAEPQDDIDPEIGRCGALLIEKLSGDYNLGGLVRNIDLLGAHSPGGLSGQYGYLEQDRRQFRVFEITVPCVVNDVWPQVP